MTIRAFGLSDIGCLRPQNEDSFICDNDRRVYAVADGIGGLPGGAEASKLAVDTLQRWFTANVGAESANYFDCLEQINEAVFTLGRRLSPRHGIGTTLTIAHFVQDTVHIIHVGDTMLFRLRDGQIETMTIEHNLENEMKARAARGEPVFALHENRAALTRCVGQPPPLHGDVSAHPVIAGDRYIVCSDGVTRGITAHEIGRILASDLTPEAISQRLVSLANERGGLDNSTVITIFASA